MTIRVRVLRVSQLANGQIRSVTAGGKELILVRTELMLASTELTLAGSGGQFYAFDARCPHAGGPLAEGSLAEEPTREGEPARCTIRCLWHDYRFDLATGRGINCRKNLRRYAVREVDGWVEVTIET